MQEKQQAGAVPTATQWTLDAAGPPQRNAIGSVFLMYCPSTHTKGTGFLLTNGLVVTNHHVVKGCELQQIAARTSSGSEIRFRKMAVDEVVDLALLRPSAPMTGGLELGSDLDPAVGSAVSTWGFPLTFNGPAPLLSVGYVAGFSSDGTQARPVKHVVVNGAFNPGNSGGPLFHSNDNKVIGVVVAKFHLYPSYVKQSIEALANMQSGLIYTGTDANGHTFQKSEGQVVALVLDQFYKNTQVMIGEAISVSELRAVMESKKDELQ
jgi:S1-C subfamily serine protease